MNIFEQLSALRKKPSPAKERVAAILHEANRKARNEAEMKVCRILADGPKTWPQIRELAGYTAKGSCSYLYVLEKRGLIYRIKGKRQADVRWKLSKGAL